MLTIGDPVRVVSDCRTYSYVGTIQKIYNNGHQRYAEVYFTERTPTGNRYQQYNIKSLVKIEEEEMKDFTLPRKELPFYIVQTKWDMDYYRCYDDNITIGSRILVEEGNNESIKTIANIFSSMKEIPTKMVMCVLDCSRYYEEKDKAKKLKTLDYAMKKRIQEIQAEITYDFYATKDNAFANLYTQYKEIADNMYPQKEGKIR